MVVPKAAQIKIISSLLKEIVGTTNSVISVISDSAFQIETFIPEVNIKDLKIGDIAKVKLDAFGKDELFDAKEFVEKLSDHFEISESKDRVVPNAPKTFGLCTSVGWFNLKFKGAIDPTSAVNALDVSILEAYVFKDKLQIVDSKTDHRLTYIKGNSPIQHIDEEVKKGTYDIVFTVYPCNIEEVFKIADQGLIMPPKSTYIEPKLRTGLTVQIV